MNRSPAPPTAPVELRIERLTASGDGLSHWEGQAVLVPRTAPGDTVQVRLTREGKQLYGEGLSVVTPGPGRQTPPCPVADRCGGCDWMHLTPEAQLQAKVEQVVRTLERAGIAPGSYGLRPPLAPPPALGYRRRATLHVGRSGLHYFARGSHQPVPIQACPALVPALSEKLPGMTQALAPAHSELREVALLAEGEACSVALRLKGAEKAVHQTAAKALLALGFQGVVLLPEGRVPILLGQPELVTDAPGAPGGRRMLRPDAFSQAHARGNDLLVETALTLLAPRTDQRALELFGGNGNFTFGLRQRVQELWMVEGNATSLALTRAAATGQRLTGLKLLQGDVAQVARGLAQEGHRFPLLLLDPPRTGFRELKTLAPALGVERLVYVACDPDSLAKDTAPLLALGYAPESLQVLDLFPQTHHVEAVMAFSRAQEAGR